MRRQRPLTKAELDLWKRSTADVRPLIDMVRTNAPAVSDPTPSPECSKSKVRRAPAPKTPPCSPRSVKASAPRALDPEGPIDIDRRNWERLKRGRVDIERKLDLHGRTQAEAHAALDRFLAMASATGLRCVLVVTGKGGGDGRGVLRQMVPRWLGEAGNRETVLTFCPAQPRHGGDGALYVLLRRRREARRR